jgi:dTDP-glucose 4,6-dehydratase
LADVVLDATGASRDLIRPKQVDAHNRKSKRPDIAKAMADLGHSPTIALEEGVPRTVEWMREVYNLPKSQTVGAAA